LILIYSLYRKNVAGGYPARQRHVSLCELPGHLHLHLHAPLRKKLWPSLLLQNTGGGRNGLGRAEEAVATSATAAAGLTM
jgi:hypothetical protein